MDKKLDDFNFFPEEIAFLAAGETRTVNVITKIPIGQYWGTYSDYFRVVSEDGGEDVVSASIDICSIVDVDVDDNHGNVSDNVMHLKGAKNDLVHGSYTVVNPNSVKTNVDLPDGPGNIRIDPVSFSVDDLVKIGDPGVVIPAGNILSGGLSSLESGEAEDIAITVLIPDGIPVNAFYQGTATVVYEGHMGGPLVSDTFTIQVEVLRTQGTLDILQTDLVEDFCPPDPWIMIGQVAFSFDVQANGDHRNIRVSSGGLKHDSLDKKLDDFNFFPEEIAFLAAGETRTINVITKIPIGQHSGLYSDYFRVVSENTGEDSVHASIGICSIYDMDIKDHYANLGDNVMEIQAISRATQSGGEWALRAFDIGLPDVLVNNHDEFDGPGNAPITCITCEFEEWSQLWTDDDRGHNYHQNKDFTGTGSVLGDSCDWSSGEFRRMLVGLYVPPMQGNDNHPGTYRGRLNCWALADVDTVGHDYFDIEIQLARIVGGGWGDGAFGGYPVKEGAMIYWGSFEGVGLTGAANLYREEPGTGVYTRVNEGSLNQDSEYLDTQVAPRILYNYKLGIDSQGTEVFIGPLSVGGAPKFFQLSQNIPNPFNDRTTISYQLPSSNQVSLKVYDLAGRLVRILRDGEEPAGFYTVEWDRKDSSGRDIANGIYFYRLDTAGFTATKKMLLLR
jgi:hypothetical protein